MTLILYDNHNVENIGNYFPNLLSLDLAYNELCNLDLVVSNLASMSHLRMLNLFGNPLALFPNYKNVVKDELNFLRILDNEKTNDLTKKHGLATTEYTNLSPLKPKVSSALQDSGFTLGPNTSMKHPDTPRKDESQLAEEGLVLLYLY